MSEARKKQRAPLRRDLARAVLLALVILLLLGGAVAVGSYGDEALLCWRIHRLAAKGPPSRDMEGFKVTRDVDLALACRWAYVLTSDRERKDRIARFLSMYDGVDGAHQLAEWAGPDTPAEQVLVDEIDNLHTRGRWTDGKPLLPDNAQVMFLREGLRKEAPPDAVFGRDYEDTAARYRLGRYEVQVYARYSFRDFRTKDRPDTVGLVTPPTLLCRIWRIDPNGVRKGLDARWGGYRASGIFRLLWMKPPEKKAQPVARLSTPASP